MAKVMIVHRNGLEYPMVRCPLTNMGIYFEKTEWNGSIDMPTFYKDIPINLNHGSFRVEDGICIYSSDSDCPVLSMQIALRDWDDAITPAEALFYKENRKKYQIVR